MDCDCRNHSRSGHYEFMAAMNGKPESRVSLLAMLEDMQAAQPAELAILKDQKQIQSAEFKKRAHEAKPRIEVWKAEGLGIKEIKSRLGVSQKTYYRYIEIYKMEEK